MSKVSKLVSLLMVMTLCYSVQGQTILAGWDFEDEDAMADEGTDGSAGTPVNLDKMILENEGANVSYPGGNAPSSGESFSTNNWASGEFIRIDVNTTNYNDLYLEFDTRSSSSGPRDFKVQYSLNGADGPFTDVEETQFQSPTSFSANPMFYFRLPEECADTGVLCLRLLCCSDTSADGSEGIGSTGTFRLDNVKITSTLDNPLPVNLSAFSAESGDRIVKLHWKTASEVNNKGFLIYRSQQKDGEYQILDSYLTNKALKGAGNSSRMNVYSWYDRGVENGIRYWYKLADVDAGGNQTLHGPVSSVPHSPEQGRQEETLPGAFRLGQNYPNPFNPSTHIVVEIPDRNQAGFYLDLSVYSVAGQKLKTLYEGTIIPGVHAFRWDGTNALERPVPGGIYFYHMKTDYYQATGRMLLIR